MADERPVKNYDGNYITCYPGSNQSDDGKLNMEFNMARFVTRVSSKNFCIVKPSYELKKFRGSNGKPQIQVGVGQCSINGMDLIMTQILTIEAPEQAGTFYLAFKLARDSSNNVLGDSIYGVTRTFEGVYLTYFDEKPDPLTDPDMLFLGKVVFDGTDIVELEEDPDKYGRIWAEDILCKLKDPKHPDITRIILQDWIYKVPDWYVSKEGDVEYGEIDFMAGRDTEGTYGIHIQATNDNNSELIMKAPSLSIDETNRILKAYAKNNGIEIDIGQSKLVSNTSNNYALDLTTPNNISVNSQGNVSLIGQNSISLGTGTNGTTPKLLLQGNKSTLTSSVSSALKDEVVFTASTLQHIIGKSIFQYTTANSKLSLLGTDTTEFDVGANTDLQQSARVKNTLYIGGASTFGSDATKLTATEWDLVSGTSSTILKPGVGTFTNPTANSGYVEVKQSNSAYSKLYNSGKLDLYNSGTSPQILLTNGSYSVTLKQTSGAKGNGSGTVSILDITAGHSKFGGDITATGEIRASKVYNAVYNGIGEIFRKSADEIIEYGDIVCVRDDGLVHKVNSVEDIDNVIGICSDTIGFELGGKDIPENEQVEVEMVGQIWVNTDNNDIKCGQWVKALPNGKCDITTNKCDRLGIVIVGTIDKKVRIVYNG